MTKRQREKKTMKKLLLVVALVASSLTPAHAEPTQTIAVIDSGVNTALFKNIVAEVCILEYSNCPNGQRFMEGKGASDVGVKTHASLNHGTSMVSIINKVNPSVNIIPIRIVGFIPTTGGPYPYSNNAVKLALDWVLANYAKYNITAVSISQGKTFADCKVPDGTAQVVAGLKANNVAVIASTGNDGNRSAMDSIACLPDVISVGATDNPSRVKGGVYDPTAKPYIARYSNGNAQTTFYLNARWMVLQTNGVEKFTPGTSNATASLAGWWTLNRKGSVAETQATISATAIEAKNEWLTGKYIKLP